MFKTINLRYLRGSEFIQFFSDIISICTKATIDTLGIKDQTVDLENKVTAIKDGYAKEQGSDITQELILIDNRRDDCLVGIRGVCEAYTNHYEPTLAEAGKLLLDKIDSFGSRLAKQSYQAETTIINKLTADFETDAEFISALGLLKLDLWAKQLKAENELFNQRFLDRINEDAQDKEESFKELRLEIMDAYKTLISHISAHATIKGTEEYLILIDPINSLIDNYNTTLKRRNQKIDEVEIPKNQESIS